MENLFFAVLVLLSGYLLYKRNRKSKSSRKTINTSFQALISESEDDSSSLSLEDRIRAAIPSKNGLYPHEILMLSQANNYSMESKDFPRYWFYAHDVKNPMVLIEKLANQNFLQKEQILDVIKRSKVDKIKEVLKGNSLKISGKKEELIGRLTENVPLNTLEPFFPSERYVPSEKGIQELQDNAYVEYIHKHGSRYELDIWDMNKLVNELPNSPYRDIIWKQLIDKSLRRLNDGDFGLYRNTLLAMSDFLTEEKKFKQALEKLAEVIAYDLSGLYNGFNPKYNYQTYFPYKDSMAKIPPGIIDMMVSLCIELKIDDTELSNILRQKFESLKLLQQLFTDEECISIVIAERDNDYQTLTQIYGVAQKRYKKFHKN